MDKSSVRHSFVSVCQKFYSDLVLINVCLIRGPLVLCFPLFPETELYLVHDRGLLSPGCSLVLLLSFRVTSTWGRPQAWLSGCSPRVGKGTLSVASPSQRVVITEPGVCLQQINNILSLAQSKRLVIWKDPDSGKEWRQEEKGMTEDEIVGWHHCLDGHEFE